VLDVVPTLLIDGQLLPERCLSRNPSVAHAEIQVPRAAAS